MAKPEAPKDHRSQVRMPAELARFIKHKAIDNSRTFNSEVVHRLKQSRQQEEEQRQGAAQ